MSLRNNRLRENHNEVDAGPLNDILFILLMFFLMISTLANPNVIKMSVPRSKSDTKSKQSVVVSVDKDKNFYVGAKKINPAFEIEGHPASGCPSKARIDPMIWVDLAKRRSQAGNTWLV